MKICVVGLGEIGSAVMEALLSYQQNASNFELCGVDISEAARKRWSNQNVPVTATIPRATHYIVAVWTTKQVIEVLSGISAAMGQDLPALISIESTIAPDAVEELVGSLFYRGFHERTVFCPHRWNPGDPEHGVFNQPRIIGSDYPEALCRGLEFYRKFMNAMDLTTGYAREAAIVKVVENAYRYAEIVLAQELKRMCERHGLNFDKIRRLANTKWNIDIREARDGVGGKCLPKDIDLLIDFDPGAWIFQILRMLNLDYATQETLHHR